MTTENRSAFDTVLDVVLYAPIGAALTLGEELPRLAARGRSQLNQRLSVARLVGQFAVAQGRREAEKLLRNGRNGHVPPATAPSPAAPVTEADPAADAAGHLAADAAIVPRSGDEGAGGPTALPVPDTSDGPTALPVPDTSDGPTALPVPDTSDGPTVLSVSQTDATAGPSGAAGRPAPDAGLLAIHGYDSLSASQVVQRLAGLSAAERQEVKAYEASHRGRRTILSRLAQLDAP